MNSWINAIILFNSEGDKREVELKQGLNIITGESKSGKSALLEIIDYCFGSYYSTIPKGIITEFTYLYVVVLKVGNSSLIIGRKAYSNEGRNKMFIKIETNKSNVKELELDYFTEENFIRRNRAIIEIEKTLGMNLTDLTEDSSSDSKTGKPSVRNMMSYLLQHQNLIASKFALFYRFDDSRKKEQVINQFPIFSGWVDQEFYTIKYELDKLIKEVKIIESEEQKRKKYLISQKEKLKEIYKDYFKMIGEEIDLEGMELERLIELKNELPEFTIDNYISSDITSRFNELNDLLEAKRRERHKYELTLSNLEESEQYGEEYLDNLEMLNSRSKVSLPSSNNYICPLCGNEHIDINKKVNEINEAITWLKSEVNAVRYRKSSFKEKIRTLKDAIEEINLDIKKIINEIKEIEKYHEEIENGKNLQEQVMYTKARIQSETDYINNNLNKPNESELSLKNDRIEELKEILSNYNLDGYYSNATAKINKTINRIINNLDFEEEYKPVNMFFDLKHNFELYYHDINTNTKIFLSEMGSGANWLACHIALFLALQRYFCEISSSPIPNFIFFDQPSQVYFPDTSEGIDDQSYNENSDVIAVKKVYKAFLDELNDIKKEYGFMPQIIVTDHVKNLDLDEYNFNNYVRKFWFGEKLI